MDLDNFALTIGIYEVAFCTDLSISYAFKVHEIYFCKSLYRGIYCNDGMLVFCGRCVRKEICQCLKKFQVNANALVGKSYFEFTMEMWNPPGRFQLQYPAGEEEDKDDDIRGRLKKR
eukprot:15367090-Ditylum_brightwellii.AAC.1